jgi:chromosome segregation ATPase
MDHLEVLREKIASLRVEIAQLQELNQQYRHQAHSDTEAQIAHGQRHERLQAIQQELAQLAGLGRRVLSVEQRKDEHRSRMNPVKQVS